VTFSTTPWPRKSAHVRSSLNRRAREVAGFFGSWAFLSHLVLCNIAHAHFVTRVNSLPYVEATILELMRYKTLFPLAVLHRTLKDTEVGGYFVPEGTTVSWRIDYVWLGESVC